MNGYNRIQIDRRKLALKWCCLHFQRRQKRGPTNGEMSTIAAEAISHGNHIIMNGQHFAKCSIGTLARAHPQRTHRSIGFALLIRPIAATRNTPSHTTFMNERAAAYQ